MGNSINCVIKPEWDEIEKARIKSEEFLEVNGFSREVLDAIVMVLGELLENGIKYGKFEQDEDHLEYSVTIGRNNITVEVKNPIDEEELDHLELLDDTIQWIRGYQNPFQAYIERIKEVSIKPLDSNDSGLGLTRIAYEGQSILDFYVNENDIIAVSAVYQLEN